MSDMSGWNCEKCCDGENFTADWLECQECGTCIEYVHTDDTPCQGPGACAFWNDGGHVAIGRVRLAPEANDELAELQALMAAAQQQANKPPESPEELLERFEKLSTAPTPVQPATGSHASGLPAPTGTMYVVTRWCGDDDDRPIIAVAGDHGVAQQLAQVGHDALMQTLGNPSEPIPWLDEWNAESHVVNYGYEIEAVPSYTGTTAPVDTGAMNPPNPTQPTPNPPAGVTVVQSAAEAFPNITKANESRPLFKRS